MRAADSRLGKLYGRLKPKQAAELILQHLADGNQTEADRVLKGLPTFKVLMRDPDTLHLVERVRFVALYWAREHWRHMVAFLSAMSLAESAVKRNDEGNTDVWCGCLADVQARLIALDEALAAFCAKSGLSADLFMRITGAPTFASFASQPYAPPILADGADAEYRAEVQEVMFAGL